MKNNTHKKFIESLQNVKLREEARIRMRAELSSYADCYPVADSMQTPSPFGSVRTYFGRFSYVFAALFLVVTSSGIVLAAHNALPGDSLYPIKTALLEPAEKALKEQTTIDWSVTLMQRRLTEADKIASTTKPSSKGEAQAAFEVADAAQKVEKNLDTPPSPAKTKATNAFNETLSKYEHTLARLTAVASTSAATGTAAVLDKLFTETHARVKKESSVETSRDRSRTQEHKPTQIINSDSDDRSEKRSE